MKAQETLAAALAEACWIAAVVLVPISCDLLSDQIFTSIKSGLSQVLGITSLLSVALHFLEVGAGKRKIRNKQLRFLAVAATGLLVSSVVSWKFSLDPSRLGGSESVVSLGPPQVAAFLGLFLGAAVFLRTREQLERMASAALASGFAVALFALLQRFGLQLPGYSAMPGMEITSFIGGPIFLAGYLLMLVPLAVWKLHTELRRTGGKMDSGVAAAASVLAALAMAFLSCEKRGPTLGLLAAGFAAVALSAALYRSHRLTRSLVFAVILATIGLGGLSLLRVQGYSFSRIPLLERLSAILPAGNERNHDYRTMLWPIIPEILLAENPLTKPTGDKDQHHSMRRLLGFGPDNVQTVLPSRYLFLQAWPSETMEVSCHNQFWDLALSLGILGVLVFFSVFFLVWYQGLLSIGARPPPLLRAFAMAVGFALLGGIGSSALLGAGFVGVGVQAAFLIALLALALWPLAPIAPPQPSCAGEHRFLIVALLAALAGHWIDIGFIFPTHENSVLFWVFSGAVVGSRGLANANDTAEEPLSNKGKSAWKAGVAAALVAAVIHSRANIGAVLRGDATIAALFGDVRQTMLTFALILAALAMACRLFDNRKPARETPGLEAAQPCAFALAIGAAYLTVLLLLTELMIRWPLNPAQPFLADLWAVHFLVAAVAAVLYSARFEAGAFWCGSGKAGATACTFAVVAATAIWAGPLTGAQAAISAGLARKSGQNSASWLDRSIGLNPNSVSGYGALADYWAAEPPSHPSSKHTPPPCLPSAERYLQKGAAISSFNLLSAKLGKVQLRRALATEDKEERMAIALKAQQNLALAVRFAPQNEPAWVDAAFIEKEFFDDQAQSEVMIARADQITFSPADYENIVEQNWGRYYLRAALREKNPRLRLHYARRASRYFEADVKAKEMAFTLAPRQDRSFLTGWAQSLLDAALAAKICGNQTEAAHAFKEADHIISAIKLSAPSSSKGLGPRSPAADAP